MPVLETLQVKSSRILLSYIVILHGLLLGLLALLGLAGPLKLLFAALLMLSLGWQLHRYARFPCLAPIVALRHDGQRWLLQLREPDGRTVEEAAWLQGDSVVPGFMLLLNFRLCGRRRRYSLLLFNDALGAEELRRLRVLLRFCGADGGVQGRKLGGNNTVS